METTPARREKRPWGTGTVYFDDRRRAWRARLPLRYDRRNLDGSYATKGEADAALAAALEQLVDAPVGAATVGSYGATWLPTRDVRATVLVRDRARWNAYVARAELASTPLAEVTPGVAGEWFASLRGRGGKKLAAQTKQSALGLLRQMFASAAAPGGPLEGRPNPTAELRVGKRDRARSHDPWTWLRLEEIEQLFACDALPLMPRTFFTVAIHSGLRAGELCGLRWEDVDFERGVLLVGYSRAEAPKNGKPREVPMLAPARAALKTWRAAYKASPSIRSPRGLVFPASHGGHHGEGYDAGWADHAERRWVRDPRSAKRRRELVVTPGWKTRAGITRAVRLHDLRHTCASHLVQGSWAPKLMARALRLEEAREWLGHSSIAVTQRYAHLCTDAIAALVTRPRDDGGGRGRTKKRVRSSSKSTTKVRAGLAARLAATGSRPRESNSGPTVYEGEGGPRFLADFLGNDPSAASVVASLRSAAERAADAITHADPYRDIRAVELVEAAIELLELVAVEKRYPDAARAGPLSGTVR